MIRVDDSIYAEPITRTTHTGSLNSGQQEAVIEIANFLESDKKVFALRGTAGTGKSFVIDYLDMHHMLNISATTNQAAMLVGGRTIHNLTGFRIKSVREWKGSLKNENPILIDEASMLPVYIMKYLMEIPNKIILVGDPAQLVVGNCVKLDEYEGYTLTQNMRAKSRAIISLVQDLSDCVDTTTMPDFKKHRGSHLEVIEDFGQYITRINEDKGEKLILAYRNTIVDKYTELCEQEGETVYKAQGKSTDTVYLDMTDLYTAYSQQKTKYNNPISLNEMLRMVLVGMSRAKHKIVIFWGKSRANSCLQR